MGWTNEVDEDAVEGVDDTEGLIERFPVDALRFRLPGEVVCVVEVTLGIANNEAT